MKQIIVPITDQNRQGIDDLMDYVKALFGDSIMTVTEGYIVETDNPGIEVIMNALVAKAGNGFVNKPAKRKYTRTGKSKTLSIARHPEDGPQEQI
jgi:hypothetical protein